MTLLVALIKSTREEEDLFLDKELAYITSIISKMIENKREKKKR
jgi:hypothetical protein